MISNGTDLSQPMPLMLQLFVEDVVETHRRALQSGAESLEEPHDELYGDRRSCVVDPRGNKWWIATHVEYVTPRELEKREGGVP